MTNYPIDAPSGLTAKNVSVTPYDAVSVSESPYNYKSGSYDWLGQRWHLKVELPLLDATKDLAHNVVAMLLLLRGQRGTFLMPMLDQPTPRGVATGMPVVDGAGQSGNQLATKGWTANTIGILKAGDWLNTGTGSSTRLYKNLTDADSDASGKAVLTLWPDLRESPADEAALIVTNCKGVFRLNNRVPYEISRPVRYKISFEAKEDLG